MKSNKGNIKNKAPNRVNSKHISKIEANCDLKLAISSFEFANLGGILLFFADLSL
jgi:hypothetical protein